MSEQRSEREVVEERRIEAVQVRFTPAELARLRQLAREARMSVSEYIRSRVFGRLDDAE